MKKELDILEQKFTEITLNSTEIETHYYHDVLNRSSYQKISKGALLNVRPFETQLTGFKLGKELTKLPKSMKNTHVYYFDHADNVLMIEIYGQTETIIHRQYYFYTDECIESIYFNHGGTLRNITLSTHRDNHIDQLINYATFGYSVSQYVYDHETLVAINVQQKEHGQDMHTNFQVIFEYEDCYLSKIIRQYPNGYEEKRYP